MKRISALVFLVCTACFTTVFAKPGQPDEDVINVKTLGARGDGVADDYEAIMAAVNLINKKGSGTLLFPKGVYYIDRYKTKEKDVADILFTGVNGLTILGEGAEIRVNAKFNRAVDEIKGNKKYSYTSIVTPLSFKNCKNVSITGMELNGDINNATKEDGVLEGSGHLLSFNNCSNVKLKNINAHHAQTDGLYIRGSSSNFMVENLVSSNNGRQGMSIIQLTDSKFINCKFNKTGVTEGKYGGHQPRAGVDIEPHTLTDIWVKNIFFDGCTFEGNLGAQFEIVIPNTTANVTLKDCIINAPDSKYQYQVILACEDALLQNCQMDLKTGSIYPVWKGKQSNSSVTITGCTIKSSGRGIIADSKSDNDVVTIDNNQLVFTGNKVRNFPYLKARNLKFTNNSVMIPSASLDDKAPSLVWGGLESSGNKFYSDNPKVKPKVSYTGTKLIADK